MRRLLHILLIVAAIAAWGVAEARAGGHGGEAALSPYIALGDLTAPVFGRTSVRGQLIVNVTLSLGEPAKHEEVVSKDPLLRDAYFQSMSRFAASAPDVTRPINLERLGRVLQHATDSVLGGGVARVLIASAAIQKMQ